jgi:sugar (pentulose or hexulose) kinase
MTSQGEFFIGLDLGTSGLKGVVLDVTGATVASSRADYPTQRPIAGASEQDPHDWVQALISVITDLAKVASPQAWLGIGLSAMIPTLVVCDAMGHPLHPAVTWEDARAEDQGRMLRDAVGERSLYEQTGQWVDGRYLLPMFARIADELPTTTAADELRLLSAKDWVLHWLTGEFATDPATATGTGAYNLSTGTYSTAITGTADGLNGRALPLLSPVTDSTTTFNMSDERARELGLPKGLPVAVGAADAMAAILGLGVTTSGDVIYLAGTSTVIVGISDHRHYDPAHRFLVTPLALEGFGHEMDLLATGSAVAWLADLMGLGSPDELVSMARAIPADSADVPTMLGYLAPGEQGALWDPSLTGVIEGMTLHTSATHMGRALLTSITNESARCLAVWDETTSTHGTIHVAGQGIDQAALQELADATGRPTHRCGHAQSPHSAVGAALVLAAALGVNPLPTHHVAQWETMPRPEKATMWQQLRQRHDEVRSRTS